MKEKKNFPINIHGLFINYYISDFSQEMKAMCDKYQTISHLAVANLFKKIG